MVRCGHPDVLAQVARGIANFAKCESRAATQGNVLALCVHFAYLGYIQEYISSKKNLQEYMGATQEAEAF